MNLCEQCVFADGRCTRREAFKPMSVKNCGDFKGAGMNPAHTTKEEDHG